MVGRRTIEVTLILTEECTLSCSYCYQKVFSPARLSVKTAVESLVSAIRHGAESLALTFFGGEPLICSTTLFEILKEARAL